MLIIALPHSANANTGYAHVHSDGHSVLRSATGPAVTLSAHAGEVVAVVPHSRMSWLHVQLPPASHGPRLAAVLQGLLEDRLLADATELHIVPAPHTTDVARQGGASLVAVCDKAWLRQALAPLQAVGMQVQRIVPELAPRATPVLHVMGTPDHAQCVLRQRGQEAQERGRLEEGRARRVGHQHMAGIHLADVHESQCQLIFVDHRSRNIARNQLAE